MAAQPKGESAEFSVHSQTDAITAKASGTVNKGTLQGANMQLAWDENTIRGTAFGKPLSVSFKGDEASGVFGESPVRLLLERRADKLNVQGLFGGRISNFRMTPTKIEGSFGKCSYDMDAKNGDFVGYRACGRPNEVVRVTIPETLKKLPDAKLALMLGLVLGNQ